MAQTPEKKVKDKCVKLLKAFDAYYFFPATHGYGRSGVPDIICCLAGEFIAIECKAGNNKPTALQEREMEDIRRRGGIALVINEDNLTMLGQLLSNIAGATTEEDDDGRC